MIHKKKEHPKEKSELHIRNKHRERYNFKQLIENAIQLRMPETTTFAEWIWYGAIYQIHKYVVENVKDKVMLDDATRQKYTEWLSTRGKETDNWVDYGKATLERTKKIISNCFISFDKIVREIIILPPELI
jgi:hypothetical protein